MDVKIVVGFRLEPSYQARLQTHFSSLQWVFTRSKHELLDEVGNADAFFGWPTDEIIGKGRNLRWLHLLGAGADGFSHKGVQARGIAVSNSRGVAASNIAEHTLALMLSFARDLPTLFRAQQDRRWTKSRDLRLFELSGQTLGIIGLGSIGQALALKASALGMRVIGVRRKEAAVDGVERVYRIDQMIEAVADCHHVAACLPGTPGSSGLIDASVFKAMRQGSFFYNVGRGSTVNTQDLLQALDGGWLAGAGLDVVDHEPLPEDHPLWHHPDVILTSHTAGNTEGYWERGIVLFEQNLRAFLADDELVTKVDLQLGY